MSSRVGISQEELRRANSSALLTYVHRHGPMTRARLTSHLGLNRSTIGDLTGALSAAGLVREGQPSAGETARKSGRPSLLVSARPSVFVLAVTLDVERIECAVVGLGGVVRARRVRHHQPGVHDMPDVVESVAFACEELLNEQGRAGWVGVGVSVPGSIRRRDGLVRFAPNLGWKDEPFNQALAQRLGCPVATGNDANLGAYAEQIRGAAQTTSEMAYIGGTVGIGGGFVAGGRLLGGHEGYAGEVGHVLVDSAGEICRCGATGCWETKIGSNQLLSAAGRLTGGGLIAVDEVIAAAEDGFDFRAATAVEDAARWIGVGLQSVVQMLNPQVIVLGGVVGRVFAARSDTVISALHRTGAINLSDHTVVRVAALGADSPLLGAAELAFEPLLADPLGLASELDHADDEAGKVAHRVRALDPAEFPDGAGALRGR